ncbi:MAG TPA: MFS transporter [Pseudonocardiaceae bacterium]|jgi:DHA2 family methylenomycin A resistance protein-like MFS transporter
MGIHDTRAADMTRVSEAPERAERVGSGRAAGTLALLCLSMFIVYLDTTIVPVVLPTARAALHADVTGSQWILDSYVLAFACLLLTAGSLGDIVGRKRVFLIGMVGFVAASVGCALASSAGELIVFRAAQGVFAAVVVPVNLALTGDIYPEPKARARAISVWGGVGGLAFAAGPVVGGLLVGPFGWSSIFWLNVPLGLAATVGLARLLPATRPPQGRRLDPVGQALFVLGAAGLTYGLIEGNAQGWSSVAIVTAFVVAAVALTGFGLWERRTAHPMLPAAVLRVPAVVAACVVNFLGLFGMFAALFLLTFYFQQEEHLPPIATGMRFLALTAAIAVSALGSPPLAARIGTRTTMIAGAVSVAIGLAGLVLVGQHTSFATYAWALVLLGLGISPSAGVVAVSAALVAVPPELTGTTSGTVNTFRQIGAALGVALAGLFVAVDGLIGGMHITFAVASTGAVLGAVAVFVALRSPARAAS